MRDEERRRRRSEDAGWSEMAGDGERWLETARGGGRRAEEQNSSRKKLEADTQWGRG